MLARLRTLAAERELSAQDVQTKFLIERLLARLFAVADPPWLLKGGFAMELRYRPRARTTRDVDLTVAPGAGSNAAARLSVIHELLRDAAAADLGDQIEYRIGNSKRSLPNAPAGGASYPVEALVAGRTFGRFHIDVGIGDPVAGEPESLVGDDLLGFAGIEPARVLAVPKAQQFAEKLHAYSFPWTDRENTRVKDLVDLVLLIERGSLDPASVTVSVREMFARRNTHPVPSSLSPPPAFWAKEYGPMANQAALSTEMIDGAFAILTAYVEPLLSSMTA